MKNIYRKKFKKDSFLLMNISPSMRYQISNKKDESIRLIYAGGLHYKRYESLALIARAISKINNQLEKQLVRLDIYTFSKVEEKVREKIELHNSIEIHEPLNTMDLKRQLNLADILVHVESFDKKSIASTRLSISTKIPEYLSLGKPILAVGPDNISSMSYVRDNAFCITKPNLIEDELKKLIEDKELRKRLGEKSLKTYQEDHNPEKNIEEFTSLLYSLM